MKKNKLSVLLSLLLLFLFAFSALGSAGGDIDGDGGVTASDARIALRIAVGLEDAAFGTPRFLAADANHDGSVTAGDARLILRAAVGLETLADIAPAPADPTPQDPAPLDEVLTRKQVYELAATFTVEITSERDDGMVLGSGFFISADGKLLTNYHVIEDTNALSVKDYNGKSYEVANVLAFDRDIDMALLQVDGKAPAYASLNKKDYGTADTVYALGSSNGYTGSFSEGMISTAERKLEGYSDVIYIQHTAAISQGNSGGPLLDDHGRVIGMNTLGDDEGNSLYFAVPVSYIDAMDLSTPMTVEEFSQAERNFKTVYFPEEYSGGVLMHPNAVGIFPFGAYSRTEATVSVKCDSDALDVSLRRIGNAYNALFVVAKKACENVQVTLYLKEYPEISATLTFTVSSAAPACGGGVLRDVPDYGAVNGVTPALVSVSGSAVPAFVYRDRSVFADRSADDLHAAFDTAMTGAGFTLGNTQSGFFGGAAVYTYTNAKLGLSVAVSETRFMNRMQSVTVTFG